MYLSKRLHLLNSKMAEISIERNDSSMHILDDKVRYITLIWNYVLLACRSICCSSASHVILSVSSNACSYDAAY